MFLSAEDKFEDKTDKWTGITYLPEECHREVQSHSLEPDRDKIAPGVFEKKLLLQDS